VLDKQKIIKYNYIKEQTKMNKQKPEMSRQLKWYYANKKRYNRDTYIYRKRLMLVGKYAISKNLLTPAELKKIEKFIFITNKEK
jgi:hypothetical protein